MVPATGGEHPKMAEQKTAVVVGKLDRDVCRGLLPLSTHTADQRTAVTGHRNVYNASLPLAV